MTLTVADKNADIAVLVLYGRLSLAYVALEL